MVNYSRMRFQADTPELLMSHFIDSSHTLEMTINGNTTNVGI